MFVIFEIIVRFYFSIHIAGTIFTAFFNLYVVLFMFIYRYINVRFQQSNKQKSQKNQQIISAD